MRARLQGHRGKSVRPASIVFLLLGLGCGPGARPPPVSMAPSAPSPPQAPETPQSPDRGTHIRGLVYRSQGDARAPVVGARVSVWVQQGNAGHHVLVATTDDQGRYDIADARDGFYVLYAENPGDLQPCAQSLTLTGTDATRDIEIIAERDVVEGRLPETIGSYTLRGTVTHGGAPAPGTSVVTEWVPDLVTATTVTDSLGHYLVCSLWTTTFDVVAVLDEGEVWPEIIVSVKGDTTVDFGN